VKSIRQNSYEDIVQGRGGEQPRGKERKGKERFGDEDWVDTRGATEGVWHSGKKKNSGTQSKKKTKKKRGGGTPYWGTIN